MPKKRDRNFEIKIDIQMSYVVTLTCHIPAPARRLILFISRA